MDENKVINEIIALREDVEIIKEIVATKDDIRRMTDLLEGITTIAKNIQEDHVFAIEWLKRLQNQFEKQEEEIRKIKLKLQIA